MKLLTGLFECMVIRRNSNGISEQPFTGTCRESGLLKVTVQTCDGQKVPGLTNHTCGQASGGKFSGSLDGLKTGGPYQITLSVGKESITLKNILVGDVWVLAGQSNIQGYGNLSGAFQNSSPMVRAY